MPEGRTVLLVDDEPVLLETTRAALESAGYSVHAMNDPTAAAAWLMARKPDILVTDVVMEGLSGIEVATLCSHRFPDVPVLLVSAFIPEDFLTESSWHRLHKPVRVARLVATVGRLRRRAERSESGDQEITRVSYLFPSLDDLSADVLGFTGL